MAKKSTKPYPEMTTAQLRKATKEFDKEFVPTRPLTAADRAKHRRARVGRPRVGQGAQVVPVSIERGLLAETDNFARRHNVPRSQLVAEGLRLILRRPRKAS
jgi:hypothetical protein